MCISCRTYKATKYIRNENLKLIARCSNCQGLDLQYSWSVIGQKTGDRVQLDENSVATPRNSRLIVVNSEVLDGKQPYTFKLDVFSEGEQFDQCLDTGCAKLRVFRHPVAEFSFQFPMSSF